MIYVDVFNDDFECSYPFTSRTLDRMMENMNKGGDLKPASNWMPITVAVKASRCTEKFSSEFYGLLWT